MTTSDTLEASETNDPEAPDAPEVPGEAAAADDVDGTQVDGEAAAEDTPPAKEVLGPGEQKSDDELAREATVLLFAAPEPLSPVRVRELLLRPSAKRVKAILERLAGEFDASPYPLLLQRIAGGWRLLTDPEFGDVVTRFEKDHKPERITAAALETLAIIAYRQPVTKAEIEAIRGVQAGAIIRALVDRGLARVTGRASLPGSPLQYGTTKDFLERFGLPSLKDLPRDGELTES